MKCGLVGWHTQAECPALARSLAGLQQTVVLMNGLVRHDGNLAFTDHTSTATTAAVTQLRWTVG